MDPIACLKECMDILDALCISSSSEDKIRLMEKLLVYSNWRMKGGFNPPDVQMIGRSHDGDWWMGWMMDQL